MKNSNKFVSAEKHKKEEVRILTNKNCEQSQKITRVLFLIAATSMVLSMAACVNASSNSSGVASSSATTSATAVYEWPKQPVNMMCPAAAVGGTDMILRLINKYFTKYTGQTFVINNVTGITGYEQTHQANTDGYDFICGTTTIFTSQLDGTLDYDWADYEMAAFIPNDYITCIAVQADSPFNSINDLFDAAKANPTEITGGISMSGQPFMFSEALKQASGFDLYYVDAGNTSERNAALLGGQVDFIITNVPSSQAYVDSGDFRFIAIDGNERYELAPEIPTFIEQGIDFCFVPQPVVYLAPKGTPKEACEAFNKILNQVYTDPEFIEEYRTTLKSIARPIPSVEESIKMGEQFKDKLAPFVK